jgi:hypothetical protein
VLATRPVCGLAVLGVLALTASGCSSSGTASPTSATGSAAPARAAARALASRMQHGLAGLRSAHVEADAGALGGRSTGNVTYAGGKASASDITLGTGSDAAEVITVGTKSWAKLPHGQNPSGKPWLPVSSNSSNQFVRGIAGQLTISQAAASVPAVADVAATATRVVDKGSTARGHHYALLVAPADSRGTTLGTLLADIGQPTVPIDVYLDRKDRPTTIDVTVKIGAQSSTITVTVSRYNAPVRILRPPADQIGS